MCHTSVAFVERRLTYVTEDARLQRQSTGNRWSSVMRQEPRLPSTWKWPRVLQQHRPMPVTAAESPAVACWPSPSCEPLLGPSVPATRCGFC